MPTLPLPFEARLGRGLVTDFGQRQYLRSKRDAGRLIQLCLPFLAALRYPVTALT